MLSCTAEKNNLLHWTAPFFFCTEAEKKLSALASAEEHEGIS